jgi:hypothetical protein
MAPGETLESDAQVTIQAATNGLPTNETAPDELRVQAADVAARSLVPALPQTPPSAFPCQPLRKQPGLLP